MEGFVITGLPATAAIAAVALIGYIFGRRTRPESRDRAEARNELKRAHSVIRNLEAIAQQVRRSLAQHHASVEQFRRHIDELDEGRPAAEMLAAEADKLMMPTEELAAEIANAYEEIRQQTTRLMDFASSRTDDTTGVSNRRGLDDALRTQLAMQRRYHTKFSLCLLEIDAFRESDRSTVQTDAALTVVADALNRHCRDTDMVCRYGEEQFAIVLPHTQLAGAALYADRVRGVVAEVASITISGGITMALDGDNAETLLARVDEALYAARAHGRGQLYQHTGLDVRPAAAHLAAVADAASAPVTSGTAAKVEAAVGSNGGSSQPPPAESWESNAAPAPSRTDSNRPLQPR